MIVYRRCQCQAWPIVVPNQVGRCKRCGECPEGEPTYDDYVELAEQLAAARRRVIALENVIVEHAPEIWVLAKDET